MIYPADLPINFFADNLTFWSLLNSTIRKNKVLIIQKAFYMVKTDTIDQ